MRENLHRLSVSKLYFAFLISVFLIFEESSTPSEMNGVLPPLSNTQPMTITSFQSTFVHVYDSGAFFFETAF